MMMRRFAKKLFPLSLVKAQGRRFRTTLTTTDQFIALEEQRSAHNYHPIPKVLSKGKGCYVWDVEGKVSRPS
jgi:hypothetical protein